MTRHCMAMLVVLFAALPVFADAQKTDALNELRTKAGLPSVGYSTVLEAAADRHARDLAVTGTFSHTGSDGSDVAARVTQVGYRWCIVAENIAKGQRDLEEVMTAWHASPGHRANMLAPDVTEFALAEAEGFVWVMVLAAQDC